MGISPSAKQFLKDNKNLINKSGFKILYDNENLSKWNVNPILISEISQIFLNSGINPLNYLDKVPKYFLYGAEISSVGIPNNIKKIEANAFLDSDIVKIEVPDSVTEIDDEAFSLCDKLKYIKFSKNVKIIPRKVCYHCPSLEFIYLQNGIEVIGEYAFDNCPKLQNVVLPESIKAIENDALPNHLKEIHYEGTKEQWMQISIAHNIIFFSPINNVIVHCINGDIVSKNLK